MEGESRWSLDFLTALPVVFIVFVVLVVLTALAFKWRRNGDRYDRPLATACAYGGIVITVIFVICAAGGFFPYEKQYHAYTQKVGVVESVSKRLLGSSDSFQEKFVVRYEDGRVFGCEDTRCALVKPGNTLVLACIRVWEYQGSDGYDCAFVRRES